MAKTKIDPVAKQFEGRWRIIEMPDFDQETIDEEVPAYIEFGKSGSGEFQFIYVCGEIDARFAKVSDRPYAAFSWVGNDENNQATGRGEAILHADGTMTGTFYVHQGDSFAFTAKAITTSSVKKKTPR